MIEREISFDVGKAVPRDYAGYSGRSDSRLEDHDIVGSSGNEVHYTSMVYVPAGQAPGWKEHDASEDTTNGGSSGWYFTSS